MHSRYSVMWKPRSIKMKITLGNLEKRSLGGHFTGIDNEKRDIRTDNWSFYKIKI